MERIPKKAALGILMAGFLAKDVHTSALSAFEELPMRPELSWKAGVEVLQEHARTGRGEVYLFGVVQKVNNGTNFTWSPFFHSTDLRVLAQKIPDSWEKTHLGDSTGSLVCIIHTHQAKAVDTLKEEDPEFATLLAGIDSKRDVSNPPSGHDLFEVEENAVVTYEGAIIDGTGIWYYRPFVKGEDRQFLSSLRYTPNTTDDPETLTIRAVKFEWMRASNTGAPIEKLLGSKMYDKLRYAYAQEGYKVRFVPLSRLETEPPCAGVDYAKNS